MDFPGTSVLAGLMLPVFLLVGSLGCSFLLLGRPLLLDPRYPAGVNDKAFSLSFIVRNIKVKEVRQKWDRYLMRH
jgi:hypothetical protein